MKVTLMHLDLNNITLKLSRWAQFDEIFPATLTSVIPHMMMIHY